MNNPIDKNQLDAIIKKSDTMPTEAQREANAFTKYVSQFEIRISDEFPPEENLIAIKGVKVFALKDLVAIKAKQKNGKSTAIAILIAALINGEWGAVSRVGEKAPCILYIDSEMKSRDTHLLLKKVYAMAGVPEGEELENITFVNLRMMDTDDCRENVEKFIQYYQPDIVFIDGIVDLISDFNDVQQSQEVVRMLLYCAEKYNTCIAAVLHTNKDTSDHNMRGHLGTILSQKVSDVFECVKDADSNIVTVKCSDNRHEPVPSWSFGFDEHGVPTPADAYVQQMAIERKVESDRKKAEAREATERMRREVAYQIVEKAGVSGLSRNELQTILMNKLNLGKSTISPIITAMIDDGYFAPGGYNGNLIVKNVMGF